MPSSSLEDVVDITVNQMHRGDRIILQIKTTESIQLVRKSLHVYDPSVRVKQLFADNQYRYHEVRFRADSLIVTELLGGVEEGIIPETILGYAVVQPEVYTIDQINLAGEQLPLLRGIQRRQAPAYTI